MEKDRAGGTAAMQTVEEGRTGQETAAAERAEMRAVGAAKELERMQVIQPGNIREAASGAARYFQWSCRWRQQGSRQRVEVRQ